MPTIGNTIITNRFPSVKPSLSAPRQIPDGARTSCAMVRKTCTPRNHGRIILSRSFLSEWPSGII